MLYQKTAPVDYFLLTFAIILLVIVPLIYMTARLYLQHLLCCSNNKHQQRDDYECITSNSNVTLENNNYDSTFDLFEDVFGAPAELQKTKASSKFTLESKGFYYSRQAESGSKFVLLGKMPNRELIAGETSIDMLYSCMKETPGVTLQITGIHQKHSAPENSLYKFKIKLLNLEADDSAWDSTTPGDTVCNVESDFIPSGELKRHVFKIYSYNGGILQNLLLRVEVYFKRNRNHIKSEYLGKCKLNLEELDPKGRSTQKEGVVLRRDWKLHRMSST